MAVAVAPEEGEPSDAKPFLKWVGGKRQLLPQLVRYAPDRNRIDTYYEPFVGGGALFFYLQPRRAILAEHESDTLISKPTMLEAARAVVELANNR